MLMKRPNFFEIGRVESVIIQNVTRDKSALKSFLWLWGYTTQSLFLQKLSEGENGLQTIYEIQPNYFFI